MCVCSIYVGGGQVWLCRYGCTRVCVGRGSIGLCLCRESEGCMSLCRCWIDADADVGCIRGHESV